MPNLCSELQQKYIEMNNLRKIIAEAMAGDDKKKKLGVPHSREAAEIKEVLDWFRKLLDSPAGIRMHIAELFRGQEFGLDPREFVKVDDDNFLYFDEFAANDRFRLPFLHFLLTHPQNRIHSLRVPPADEALMMLIKILKNENCRLKKIKLNTDIIQPNFAGEVISDFSQTKRASGAVAELIVEGYDDTMRASRLLADMVKNFNANQVRKLKFELVKQGFLGILKNYLQQGRGDFIDELEFSIDKNDGVYKPERREELKELAEQKGIKLTIHVLDIKK